MHSLYDKREKQTLKLWNDNFLLREKCIYLSKRKYLEGQDYLWIKYRWFSIPRFLPLLILGG